MTVLTRLLALVSLLLVSALPAAADDAKDSRLLAPFPEAAKLSRDYAAATAHLHKAYGPSVEPGDLPIIAGADFFFLRPWFRFRAKPELGAFAFNPAAVADLEGLERNEDQCRFRAADGRSYSTWDTVVRAERYLHNLLHRYREVGQFSWSTLYLMQPQVRHWYEGNRAGAWYDARYGEAYRKRMLAEVQRAYADPGHPAPASDKFDLDVLFSLHAEVMDGSHQPFKHTDCGGYGEFRACERPPVPPPAEREALVRKDLPLLKRIAEYLNSWRTSQRLSEDPIVLAAAIRKDLNTLHPFRDGNGRTAKLLMQLILLTVGLPQSSLQHGYLELHQSPAEYAATVRDGIARSTAIIESCARFVDCANQAGLLKRNEWTALCAPPLAAHRCAAELLSMHFESPAEDYRLAPCDCSPRWLSDRVALPQCREQRSAKGDDHKKASRIANLP